MNLRRSAALPLGAGALIAAVLGRMSVDLPQIALALATVPAVIAVSISSAGVLVAAVVPSVFFTYRIGQSALDMSIADLTLVVGTVFAIIGTTRYGKTLGGLLRVVAAYEILMVIVVAAHPTDLAITEWVHRAGLMAGGMLVGAAVVRYNKVTLAIRLLLAVAVVFSLDAAYVCARTGFNPAYPLGIHKNAAGGILAMTIALVATAPVSAGVPVRFRAHLYFVLGVGLFATRSRGAIVGLGFVLLLWVFSNNGGTRLRFLAVVTAVAGAAFVWASIQSERQTDVGGFGSISTRERQHAEAWKVFQRDPVSGGGIRYYDKQPYLAPSGRPSSTIDEAEAESGYVGTAGLALVVIAPLLLLRRSGSEWKTMGLAVYGVKAVHGLFDNFWVAGPFTLPWLIIGIVAAMELAEESEVDAEEKAEAGAPAFTLTP
jgi:hypothetical protein